MNLHTVFTLLLLLDILGLSVANALIATQRQQAERQRHAEQAEVLRQQQEQRATALSQQLAAAAQIQLQQDLERRARALAKKKQKEVERKRREEERRLRKEQQREAQQSRLSVPAAVTVDSTESSSDIATTDGIAVPIGTLDERVPESSRKRQHELLDERPTEPGGGQLILFSRDVRTEPSPKKNKNDSSDLPPLLGTEPWIWSEPSALAPVTVRAPAFSEEIDLPPGDDL
jgi:hypothetical protein